MQGRDCEKNSPCSSATRRQVACSRDGGGGYLHSHLYPSPFRQLEMTLTNSSRLNGRLSSHAIIIICCCCCCSPSSSDRLDTKTKNKGDRIREEGDKEAQRFISREEFTTPNADTTPILAPEEETRPEHILTDDFTLMFSTPLWALGHQNQPNQLMKTDSTTDVRYKRFHSFSTGTGTGEYLE